MPLEGLVLDGLNLQAGIYSLTSLSMPPPKKKPEWAEFSDDSGGLLVRDPLFENRVIDATVEVRAASRNAGQAGVGAIVDKLEKADEHRGGIPLVWTPASSTEALTFYVLSGEIADFPLTVERAYSATPPLLTLELSLTCKPFGYGNEVAVPSVSASTPLVTLSVPAVGGDVPAEARLVVSDAASQTRNFVAWGLEQRTYSGNDLQLNTPELTLTGFAGVSTTRSGSLSSNVFRGTLTTAAVAVCGTRDETHVGSFRVFCRYWPSGRGVALRLVWRDGDSPFSTNPWASPLTHDAWCEADLGLITVPPAALGTQRWTGQIEAYSDRATGGDVVDIDYLLLVPTEYGFGKARRPVSFQTPTAFSVRDEFNQTAGSLTGKTAPTGQAWGGAGDAGDFAVEATGHTAQRSEVSDADVNTGRYATANVSMTSQIVQVDHKHNKTGVWVQAQETGVLARYVDSSNWLRVVTRSSSGYRFEVQKRVAGTVWVLFGTDDIPFQPPNVWYTFRLAVDTAGRWAAWYYPQGGGANSPPVAQGQDTVLATSGALASGKPGFYDANTGGEPPGGVQPYVRQFDNFSAFVPVAGAVCWSGQSVEFRHDQTLREDSTGSYWGPPDLYRGAPFFLPAAGDENRISRVAVMARRNDIETLPEANVTDATSAGLFYTPRQLVVPR